VEVLLIKILLLSNYFLSSLYSSQNSPAPNRLNTSQGGKWNNERGSNNSSNNNYNYGPDGLCPPNLRLEQELFEVLLLLFF
jgi:hypothetical protein